MASATAVARARHAVQTITVQAGKEVNTPKKPKTGERLQFSSRDGRFRIEFPAEWPFTKPHSSNGSRFDKSISSRFYKADQLWKSRRLILVEGGSAKFNCFLIDRDTVKRLEYGGEVNPRGK